MSSSPAPTAGTSSADTVNFTNSKSGVTYDAGAGNDSITGSKGDDVIRGGTGADRIMGGAGNDTYVFVAGDLINSLGQNNGQNGSIDHIIDFQGGGANTASGYQDKIALYGYSASAYLRFDHYGADRVQSGTNPDGSAKYILQTNYKMQYYQVYDPTDTSKNGFILVQMQDGTAQLDVSKTSSDVVFYRDTVTGTSTGAVIEAGGENNGLLGAPTASGKLTATTFDQATSFQAPDLAAVIGKYGSFLFTADGAWVYSLDNTRAETQALKAGETKVEMLTVHTQDGTEATISVTVTGANDKAVIGGTDTGSVKEDATLTSFGKLTVTDVDAEQEFFLAHEGASTLKGSYGSLTIDAAGNWSYTLDNSSKSVQALGEGQSLNDRITVSSLDGTEHDIIISVAGMNESKPINPINLADVASGIGGFKLVGPGLNTTYDSSAEIVSDVNGDGIADIIIGGLYARYQNQIVGFSQIIYGSHDISANDLSSLGSDMNGFKVRSGYQYEEAGKAVSGAGDFNGDGISDFVISSRDNSDAGRSQNGAVYIVYGSSAMTSIDAKDTAANATGLKISGASDSDRIADELASLGDINKDGFDDIFIGSQYRASEGYIVFGKNGSSSIDLRDVAVGIGGFKIVAESPSDGLGLSASSAGDVNGDGIDDFIVGTRNSFNNTGAAYVVFGSEDLREVNLADVSAGRGGFKINGEFYGDLAGIGVSNAGDVNGDGLSDLIVGAPENDSTGPGGGAAYVVFGKSDTINVNLRDVAAGQGGFKILAQQAHDGAGYTVSSISDLNKDGYDDVVVGAYANSSNGFTENGATYVVFGKSSTTSVDLNEIAAGRGGFVIQGQEDYSRSSAMLSSGGDVNGDGLEEIIISQFGSPYIVFGRADWIAT